MIFFRGIMWFDLLQLIDITAVAKNKRSMSWSDAYDPGDELVRLMPNGNASVSKEEEEEESELSLEKEKLEHDNNTRMLDPNIWEQYDRYKMAYASMLYNWQLFNQRAVLLKFISAPTPQHTGLEFGVCCHNCGKDIRGPQCGWCKYPAFQCSVCHSGVKGLSNFCMVCGHGGHTAHLMEWFQTQSVCPTGCGCKCTRENFFAS